MSTGGGFSFGGGTGSNFGFTTPKTQAAGTGLTFGSPAPAATTTTSALGSGLSFASTATTAQQPLTFGTPTLGQAAGAATLTLKGFAANTQSSSQPAATSSAPQTAGFNFSSNLGQSTAAAPSALGGGIFAGLAAKTSTGAVTATTTSAPAPALTLGGGSLATKPTTSSSAFGSFTATSGVFAKPATTSSVAPTTNTQSVLGGLLQGTTGTTTSASTGLSLGGKPVAQPSSQLPSVTAAAATTAASLSTDTTTTASASAAPSMNYRQLEEEINKWSVELQEQEKIFIQQATQVNAWDRLLIDNGENIASLNGEVERVKLDQQRLDGELDFINAQQRELEEMLQPLEQAVEHLPPISFQQHADLEREHTFKLAENIDAQLKRMVQDLKEIIDHINTSNSSADANDPAQQIAKILNAHMHSLQWIDSNTALLQRRVDDVTKLADHRKKEQERNFRLAYD